MSWKKRFLFITVAVLLLGAFSLPAASAASPSGATAVSLVDNRGALITAVLSARRAGTDMVSAQGKPGPDGSILMNLPPGRYYFTGDVSVLSANPAYGSNLKGNGEMMFYYISPPVDITENTGKITLAIDSTSYIDIADIAGDPGFKFHIIQDQLEINTAIIAKSNSSWVRLYLPMYKQYTVQSIEGIFHLKWPVFATPKLQFVFSAT